MKTYEEILKFIGFPTINRFYELENCEFTDFVIKGIAHIVKGTLNLKILDSTGRIFSKRYDDEAIVKLYTKIEYIKDNDKIENIVDLGDFIRVKVLQHNINVSSARVLYVDLKTKLIE